MSTELKYQHFFKPLLPGFKTHLDIPAAFIKRHLGKTAGEQKFILISAACDDEWEVLVVGRRLTEGWSAFANAHSYRVGDMLVFKYLGNKKFKVIAFGSSCCEIQYEEVKTEPEEFDNQAIGTTPNEHLQRKRARNSNGGNGLIKGESSCPSLAGDEEVILSVTKDNIKSSRIGLPAKFWRKNKLDVLAGQKISISNESRDVWNVELVKEKDNRMRLGEGFKKFLNGNGIGVHDTFTLRVVWDVTPKPSLFLCSKSNA